jgi:putative ABC transport system permease protein
VLVLGTTVALFLPVFTVISVDLVGGALMRRAEESPVLIGAKGNEFDLTMSSLYFRGQVTDFVTVAEQSRAEHYGLAIPLFVSYSTGGTPIVGTSLEYLDARQLSVARGRAPAVLGELVAGAEIARRYDLEPGDTVRSDLNNLYNIAGSYPIVLKVVGILAPSASPDDEAFFADLKTTWLLDGRLHGHREVDSELALNPEAGEGENLEATAAIFLFTDFSAQSPESFHLHGDLKDAPLTAVLVFPESQRSHDQLIGDFALEDTLQAVRPTLVMRTVLGIVLRVQEGLSIYFATVTTSTIAFFGLVLTLSLRLRRGEMRLMRRIGCSRSAIALIVGTEVGLIVVAAVCLTALVSAVALPLVRSQLGL